MSRSAWQVMHEQHDLVLTGGSTQSDDTLDGEVFLAFWKCWRQGGDRSRAYSVLRSSAIRVEVNT